MSNTGWIVAGGAALIGLALAAPGAAASQGAEPGGLWPAIARPVDQYAKSRLLSYCVSTEPGGNGRRAAECSLAPPPTSPPRRRLTIAPREEFTVRFRHRKGLRDQIGALTAVLVRIGPSGSRVRGSITEIEQVGEKRWRLRMPRRLRRANGFELHAELPADGDATHLFGLRSRRRSPLSCPHRPNTRVRGKPLRGRSERAAAEVAKRRGCELRVVERDGVEQLVTHDLRGDRVNVAIDEGTVSRVFGIF